MIDTINQALYDAAKPCRKIAVKREKAAKRDLLAALSAAAEVAGLPAKLNNTSFAALVGMLRSGVAGLGDSDQQVNFEVDGMNAIAVYTGVRSDQTDTPPEAATRIEQNQMPEADSAPEGSGAGSPGSGMSIDTATDAIETTLKPAPAAPTVAKVVTDNTVLAGNGDAPPAKLSIATGAATTTSAVGSFDAAALASDAASPRNSNDKIERPVLSSSRMNGEGARSSRFDNLPRPGGGTYTRVTPEANAPEPGRNFENPQLSEAAPATITR